MNASLRISAGAVGAYEGPGPSLGNLPRRKDSALRSPLARRVALPENDERSRCRRGGHEEAQVGGIKRRVDQQQAAGGRASEQTKQNPAEPQPFLSRRRPAGEVGDQDDNRCSRSGGEYALHMEPS